MKSEIVIPIFLNSENIGQIDIDSHRKSPFTKKMKSYWNLYVTKLRYFSPLIEKIFKAQNPLYSSAIELKLNEYTKKIETIKQRIQVNFPSPKTGMLKFYYN